MFLAAFTSNSHLTLLALVLCRGILKCGMLLCTLVAAVTSNSLRTPLLLLSVVEFSNVVILGELAISGNRPYARRTRLRSGLRDRGDALGVAFCGLGFLIL